MKVIKIKKTNPAFIEWVRTKRRQKKIRFEKYFEEINKRSNDTSK